MKHRKTLSSQDRNDRLLLRIAETAWRQPWHVDEKPGVASDDRKGRTLAGPPRAVFIRQRQVRHLMGNHARSPEMRPRQCTRHAQPPKREGASDLEVPLATARLQQHEQQGCANHGKDDRTDAAQAI